MKNERFPWWRFTLSMWTSKDVERECSVVVKPFHVFISQRVTLIYVEKKKDQWWYLMHDPACCANYHEEGALGLMQILKWLGRFVNKKGKIV